MEPIRIHFTKEYIQPWMLAYYIGRLSTLLARLELCIQIPHVLAKGIDPRKIYLLQRSRDLWDEPRQPAHSDDLEWIPLDSAQNQLQKEFFHYLNRVKPPERLDSY